MKRFLAMISQQTRKYDACRYEPSTDAPSSFSYAETRVPMLPVMNAAVKDGERIQVILVSATNEESQKKVFLNPDSPLAVLGDTLARTRQVLEKQDPGSPERMKVEAPLKALADALEEFKKPAFERNLQYTCDEIEAWAAKKNVSLNIRVIKNNEPSTMRELLTLYKALIEAVEEEYDPDDIFYVDITFGTKPMTLLLMYIMRYIRSIKGNDIENITYGQVFWNQNRAELHELSALFHLDSLVSRLSDINLPSAERIVLYSLDSALSEEERGADEDDF